MDKSSLLTLLAAKTKKQGHLLVKNNNVLACIQAAMACIPSCHLSAHLVDTRNPSTLSSCIIKVRLEPLSTHPSTFSSLYHKSEVRTSLFHQESLYAQLLISYICVVRTSLSTCPPTWWTLGTPPLTAPDII